MSDGARCHYCRKNPCVCAEPKPLQPLSKEEREILKTVQPNDKANNQEEYEAWVVEQ